MSTLGNKISFTLQCLYRKQDAELDLVFCLVITQLLLPRNKIICHSYSVIINAMTSVNQLLFFSSILGKSLYVQRLYEKLERSVDEGKAFKKCIRLTEHEVDDHKILQFLYDTPKQKDIKVFHFDVTSSVSNLM